ncbi:MAG: N-acetylglucosamine-6-phosphate deacetylase [Rhodospirillales bacterium 69-11]|nr:N-acetylglucosamine-6-phosphate deacetylase [Rhodospirillales bacterium]OJW27411.1 MAG: N-acetylglucosamine-6-phosphate deacetylase [Rhodospirillales bacterium 69-11]
MRSDGLLDLQVNGYAGVDFNDPGLTAAAMDHALEAMLAAGVTRCLPTLITADEATLGARFAALDRAVADSRLGAAMVPGYHLEGPFLNPGEGTAGCHPPEAMHAPDPRLLDRLARDLRRPILLLTLAPERPDAAAVLAWARGRGVLLAMGHTAADLDTVTRAAAAGVRLSTHLGNGLPHLLPKFLNPLMAQLAEDRLHASVIADGIHVPVHALRVMTRAKGADRVVLVTDATAAAAAPPGLYGFAGMTIEHAADGSVRVPGGRTLAGSGLRLDQAVRNVVGWGLATPAQALAWASAAPASLLAPALAAHGIALEAGSVTWSDALRPGTIILGDLRLQPA